MAAFVLRKPCLCGCDTGLIETKNGQDVLRCESCGKYQYNAPKTETGRNTRTIQTVHASIKPSVWLKVIERSNGRCEYCGKPASDCTLGLHVGHVISVKNGVRQGLADDEINSLENLVALCDECNIGMAENIVPIRFLISIIKSCLNLGNSGAAV